MIHIITDGYKVPVRVTNMAEYQQTGFENFRNYLQETYGVPIRTIYAFSTPIFMEGDALNVVRIAPSKFAEDGFMLLSQTIITGREEPTPMALNDSGTYMFHSYIDGELIDSYIEFSDGEGYAMGYLINADNITADDIEYYQFGTPYYIELGGAFPDTIEDDITLTDVFDTLGFVGSSGGTAETPKAVTNLQETLPVQKHMTKHGHARDISKSSDYDDGIMLYSAGYVEDKWHPYGQDLTYYSTNKYSWLLDEPNEYSDELVDKPAGLYQCNNAESCAEFSFAPGHGVRNGGGFWMDDYGVIDTRLIRAPKNLKGEPTAWTSRPPQWKNDTYRSIYDGHTRHDIIS